jgi:hypothetical protein
MLLANACNVDNAEVGHDENSRTEVDSHANMPVVGRNAYVISDTGKVADVSPFTPDYKSMQIKVVDAAVQYDCPYTGTSAYILVLPNALHVPSMRHNLLPPFILRQAGLNVKEVPKIHVDEPTTADHSITFPKTWFRIPLSLWGIFSYFPTMKPTARMMQESEEIYLLTPSRFNPHDDAYAANEGSTLDWEGNIVERQHRSTVLLTDVEEDESMNISAVVSSAKTRMIDRVLDAANVSEEKVGRSYQPIPHAAAEISSTLAEVSPLLDDALLYGRLAARPELGKFKVSIGSTDAPSSAYLVEDDDTAATGPSTDDSDYDSSEDHDNKDSRLLDQVYTGTTKGEIDLDNFMVSASHARRTQGIDAAHLSKVWRISLDQVERTLGITTQTSVRTDDPKLSRNYGTNDRKLRYKRIHEHFFMDTCFATKKAGKSSQKNTCCQLFVTDKGFVYVVPMTSKSEVLQAVKQFAKEIGALEAIICDAAAEQKSKDLRKFLGELGTTLRVLEEGTPWANKAGLYIGLIKEAVRKDMKDFDCPLAF